MSSFSATSLREQVTFDEMIMMCAFYKTNTLSWIFIVLAHWINNPQTCRSTQTHYSDSKQTSLFFSYSLMLHAWQRSNKYTFYSLRFYIPWTRTHYLMYLMWACLTITLPMWFVGFGGIIMKMILNSFYHG